MNRMTKKERGYLGYLQGSEPENANAEDAVRMEGIVFGFMSKP